MVEYCAVEPLPRQGGVAPRLHRTRFKSVSYWTKVQSPTSMAENFAGMT